MNRIEGITDKPKQQTTIVLADGSNVLLLLEYRPNQLGWFYDLAWGDFALNGLRLVTSPSVLRAFRHVLPFDLAVLATANVEPLNQTDFADGTCVVYLLEGADLAAVNAAVYPGD
jgi:hypothetical protein